MAAPTNDENGLELTELSLRDEHNDNDDSQLGEANSDDGSGDSGVQGYGRRRERDQDAEDRAPLLASDAGAKAARRARRVQQREEKATLLRRQLRLLWKTSCGLLAVGTLISVTATLLATVELRRHLGRIYFALPLMLHLFLDAIAAIAPLLAAKSDGQSEPPPRRPMSQVEFQRQLQAGQTPQDPLHDDGRDCCCCRSLDADNDADEAPCSPRVSRGLALAIVLGYTLLDTVNCLLLSSGFIGAARGLSVEADGTIAPERTGAHGALTAVGVILGLGAGVRVLASLSIGVYLRSRYRLTNILRGSGLPWHYTMSNRMQRLALRQAGVLLAGASVLLMVGVGSHLVHMAVDTSGNRHYDQCDPLDATMCVLPFPSSYFLTDEASSSTGFRVSFGPRSLPYTRGRRNISPDAINAFDGFSTLAPILFYLEGMAASGFAGPGDIGASLFTNSTTWLIEADTERMVPHFVELDTMDPRTPLAVLQPAVPLRHATRYIVAVCGALGDWGELLSPTPGFRDLVETSQADRTARIRPELRSRAERFSEQVFPVLRRKVAGDDMTVMKEKEGTAGLLGAGLGDVQLAWDFVTASEDGQLGDLRAMRDTMLSWLDRELSAGGCEGAEDGPGGESEASSCEGERGRTMRADVMTSSEEGLRARRLRSGDNRGSSVVMHRDARWDHIASHEGEQGERSVLSGTSGVSRTSVKGHIFERFLDSTSSSSVDDASDDGDRDGNSGGELTTLAPYRVVKVEIEEDSPIARTVWARMRVPAFVSPRARGAGIEVRVAANGDRQEKEEEWGKRLGDMETLEVGFVVRVPRCVASGEKAPTRVIQFGHGLFGDRSEVLSGFLGEMAESGAWVLVAADWRGLSRIDLVTVVGALVSRPEMLVAGIADDLMQGFVNQEAVLTLVSRRLRDFLGNKAVTFPEKGGSGTAIPCGFYGISEGAILGAGYSEFSTMVERSVLGSGGTPFSFLMPRSVDFSVYRDLLQLNIPRARDVRLVLSLLQMSWDRLEASAWLAGPPASAEEHVGGGGGGNDATRQQKAVLMQGGTGDAEVSILGTEILARAYKATSVPPVSVAIWGVPTSTSGTAHCVENQANEWSCCFGEGGGASLAVYNYEREAAEVPEDDTPPPPGLVHECVRYDPAARQQVLKFFETGCVVNFCDGACDRPYCSPSP